jgi:hypothetical protein
MSRERKRDREIIILHGQQGSLNFYLFILVHDQNPQPLIFFLPFDLLISKMNLAIWDPLLLQRQETP